MVDPGFGGRGHIGGDLVQQCGADGVFVHADRHDHHGDDQPYDVDGQSPLATWNLLIRILAGGGGRDVRGGVQAGCVEDDRAGVLGAPGLLPHLGPQQIVVRLVQAVVAPGVEVVLHRRCRREVRRQQRPRAASPVLVEDGVHDVAHVVHPVMAADRRVLRLPRLDHRTDPPPLLVGGVGVVQPVPHRASPAPAIAPSGRFRHTPPERATTKPSRTGTKPAPGRLTQPKRQNGHDVAFSPLRRSVNRAHDTLVFRSVSFACTWNPTTGA